MTNDTKDLLISIKAPDVAEPVAVWMEMEMVGVLLKTSLVMWS